MRTFQTISELNATLALAPLEPGAFRFAKQFMPAGFRCADCGEVKPFKIQGGTGYGRLNDNPEAMVCYACCGKREMATMRATGKATLYLFQNHVTNWPGTLKIPCTVRTGRHNIARVRRDVWFSFEGARWHGVQYGDNSQICKCRRLKGK
jgi:hypothetical protein